MDEKKQMQDIALLQDIRLKLDIQVGSVEKRLLDIVNLKVGDVITLDKNIEEYIEVKLNNQSFALGELLIANGKYGIRIVDLAK